MLDPEFFKQAAPAAARVTQSTALILVSAFVGARADASFDTSPWLFLTGLGLGSVLGLVTLLRGLLSSDDDEPTDPPQ